MDRKDEAPPIIFTDDGWILSASQPTVTVDDIQTKMIDGYAGTGGSFWWSIGDHEVYQFETQQGEIFGADRTSFDDNLRSFVHSPTPGVMPRIAQNIRGLIDEVGGPMTALTQLTRKAGLPFFPRIRMNSHYDMDVRHPAYGRFRRENPQLLIGRPGESISEGTLEWGIRTGLDFSFSKVREHRLSIIFEVVERFDVDGVELDFMRHPAFFRIDEAFGHRHLITGLISDTRRRLDELSRERGKPLKLAVRVPPTLYDSMRIGLDVGDWISERLVDIVVVGGGFIPFETPIGEFVAAASGTECAVYGCIEATVMADQRNLRAAASLWRNAGAAGVYLYNFYTMSLDWNRQAALELSDPEGLSKLDKRYELVRPRSYEGTSGHSIAFKYSSPVTQLPVSLLPDCLGNISPGPKFKISIADDISSSLIDGSLDECSLRLHLEQNSAPPGILGVELNGNILPPNAAVQISKWRRKKIPATFWVQYPALIKDEVQEGLTQQYALDPAWLMNGENTIRVWLDSTSGDPIVINAIEIDVGYK